MARGNNITDNDITIHWGNTLFITIIIKNENFENIQATYGRMGPLLENVSLKISWEYECYRELGA